MSDSRPTADRWQARPLLAAGLKALILALPIALSLLVTWTVRRMLPTPDGWPLHVAWWVTLLGIGVGVAVAAERVARRALPLATLLKLSMLFPDRAPSRFAVAKQTGSVQRLQARLEELLAEGNGAEARNADTVLALATTLQNHDRRTRGHAERVRVFTDLLGEELNLPEDDRYRLRWAALLHDIGKITVRPAIINKPGKLDDREWSIMQTHPTEGARIAGPLLEWLGPWGHAIAEHHERFDGAGYPNRLEGEDISLAGRIVAVADAYDTMTAARSYKKPMAVRAARLELAACAGGQFDPGVVRAFFSISLPLLLWKTGPLSFFAHLPFLAWIREAGQQSVSVAMQGVTAATVAAGVTAIAVVGPAAASPEPFRGATAVEVSGVMGASATGPGSPSVEPSDAPPGEEPQPATSPAPSGSPLPGITPSPIPTTTPGPTTSPEPGDSPTPGPGSTTAPTPGPSTSPTTEPDPGATTPPPVPSETEPPPLPSVSLPIPLPSVSLPVPLPSVSLPIPLPSISLPVPLPSISLPPLPGPQSDAASPATDKEPTSKDAAV